MDGWRETKEERCSRQGHGQDATTGAGEGVGDVVILGDDGLGLRHV